MSSDTAIVDLADRHSPDLDVTHHRSGRTARIDAAPGKALDVFEHPFAYGALA